MSERVAWIVERSFGASGWKPVSMYFGRVAALIAKDDLKQFYSANKSWRFRVVAYTPRSSK